DLDLLTKRQKQIIEMRREGRTLEEIGQELNITKQAVDNIIQGARKRNHKIMSSPVEYYRIKNKLSKVQVCEILGINERSYERRLAGHTEFKLSEAFKLASLYNCSLDD